MWPISVIKSGHVRPTSVLVWRFVRSLLKIIMHTKYDYMDWIGGLRGCQFESHAVAREFYKWMGTTEIIEMLECREHGKAWLTQFEVFFGFQKTLVQNMQVICLVNRMHYNNNTSCFFPHYKFSLRAEGTALTVCICLWWG